MGVSGWFTARLQELSHRVMAGLLAGTSVLASRPAADLMSTTAEWFEVGVSFFLFYQTIVGAGLVGHYIRWLFLGYIVYAYTPELYLGYYGDIVEDRGFRILTAAVTGYFGLVFSRPLGAVPAMGPFVFLPDSVSGFLAALMVGAFASVFVFSGYIFWIRGERLYGGEEEHFEVFDAFQVDSQQEVRQKVQSLPLRLRRMVTALNESIMGGIYVIPCIFLGVVQVFVNLFSPLPEGFVVVGVLVSIVPGGDRLPGYLPDRTSGDIEHRIGDKVTNALKNDKGFILAIFCLSGLGISGANSLLFFTVSVGLLREFADMRLALPQWIVLVLFIIGILTILFVYAMFGLLYWFRQLRRLPLYVEFWEEYWRGETQEPPPATVTRPYGLFLPGVALIIVLAVLMWLVRDGDLSLVLWIAFTLAWPVVVGLALWSMRYAYRHDPQSLSGEGRDVTVAFLLQMGSVSFLFASLDEYHGTSVLLSILLLLVGAVHFPEVAVYAGRQSGIASFINVFYFGILFALGIFILETFAAVPSVVYILVTGLLIVWILLEYLNEFVASSQK